MSNDSTGLRGPACGKATAECIVRRRRRHAGSSVLCAISVALASAAVAATAPSPPAASTDETVTLTPFVVTSDKDVGYLATSTLASSRLNTPLLDVAAQISVFTPEFLKDLALTNLEEVYLYSTNVESYLEYTPGGDQGANYGTGGLLRNNNRIRGLGQATNLRNFFATGFEIDTYAAERVTIASGPNAILFGLGKLVENQREWRVNAIVAYKVTEGRLRGVSVGGGGRWRSAATVGYRLKTTAGGQPVLDLTSPFRGPTELYVDGFASYSFRPWTVGSLTSKWRLQLNVRNLLDEHDLLPTQVRVDGRPKVYTYQSPRQFILSVDSEF